MPKLCRDEDLGLTGHPCTTQIGVKATQFTVRANGIPVARLNDPALPHTWLVGIYCVNHSGAKVNMASTTVFAEGKAVARVTDSFDFGQMIEGSSNVRAG